MSDRAARIARGAGWLYAVRWADRLLGFVSLTILAHLLLKEDFGLVAVATSVVAVIEGLSEFDVKSALIQSRDEGREVYDCAWSMSALRGLLAAAVMVGVAALVQDPRVASILLVLAAVPLLDGLANPRFVMFERDLVYSKLAAQTLIAGPFAFLVTLGIAVAFRSYWALVLGLVAGSLARTVMSFVLRPYLPRPTLARWRDILSFSGWMTLAAVVSTLAMRTDRIIVGKLLGFADAGAYFMTQRIGVLPTGELISPLQRVLFPSFSEIVADRARLRGAVVGAVQIMATLSLPAAVGFALIANDFVPLVLGERWRSIAPLLVVLVPFLGLRSTLSTARPAVMALGRTQLMFRVSLAYALVHLPAFVLGTLFFGLEGAIWSIVLAGLFYVFLNAWLLQQAVGMPFLETARCLLRPAASVGAMTAALLLLGLVLPFDLWSDQGSWAALVTKALVGALVFCAVQLGLWRLAGRPDGLERRVLRLFSRSRLKRPG